MMKKIILLCGLLYGATGFAQEEQENKLLSELSGKVCKCIDSIPTHIRPDAIAYRINNCIDEMAVAYQLGSKMGSVQDDLEKSGKNQKKEVNLTLNTDKESSEYKKYYYEMESYLMAHCPALKNLMTADDRKRQFSMSENPKALESFYEGNKETQNENWVKAIEHFQKAVAIDPKFAFAYDNIGVCYRKMENYDAAIVAYEKSLSIDPNGTLPLQNLAVIYMYQKKYDLAINTYQKLAEIDPENPEVFYGIGHLYISFTEEYEKGLEQMCKAYKLYAAAQSPYRSDAEKIIQMAYQKMKKAGKEKDFYEILKKNNLNPQ